MKPRGAAFEDYPHLSENEFLEVCHGLGRVYSRATLGPLRRRWRLSVRTAFSTAATSDLEYSTYVEITRPLDLGDDSTDRDLARTLGGFFMDEDRAMVEAEDADEAALPREIQDDGSPSVTYEIHRHQTYRAPCLWFSLHNLPAEEPAFNIDTVFRRLVPDQFKDRLRGMGSMGGISADYHPVTGVPSFFVHPCLLGEAMAEFDCSKDDYLMVWIGLVGACVSLWVPKELALP